MFKKFATGVAILVGVAHIGVLGHLLKEDEVAVVPLPPVGEYTTFTIESTREGYTITYRGNDPTVLSTETNITREGGFLGMGGDRRTHTRTEYTQDGARNQIPGAGDEGKLSAEQVACIEAAGGGRSSGALVGTSVAATAVPVVTTIPYVGWLAAGWMTLFGAELGGDIGAGVASAVNGC